MNEQVTLSQIIAEVKAKLKNNFAPALLFFAIIIGFQSYYTVQPDEEAVVLRFGKYIETTSSGLHFKLPFRIDRVIKVKTKQILQQEFGFRSSTNDNGRTSYSSKSFTNESLMLTGDLNVADVEWVVQFQISDPYKFLYKTRDPITNIRDVSQAVMRRVVGDKLFSDVITEGRIQIVAEAKRLTQEILTQYDMGVTLVSIQLQGVTPPEKVKASFNEFNAATQEREKMINQAEKFYNKVIPEARGKAEEKITVAEGYAKAVVNQAQGDASKFRLIVREYKKAPKPTKTRLYLESMEKIFAKLENITVVDESVKGLMPIMGQSPVLRK